VLVVTEPTVSGIHDLERVAELTAHFNIRTFVCINKADINNSNTLSIRNLARARNFNVVAEIPYDTAFTRAQMKGLSIIEAENGETADAIRSMWETMKCEIL